MKHYDKDTESRRKKLMSLPRYVRIPAALFLFVIGWIVACPELRSELLDELAEFL